jgi:branched-chain amino acid transport system substrate-binding protein
VKGGPAVKTGVPGRNLPRILASACSLLLAGAAAVCAAGCSSVSQAEDNAGSQLTIYSSLPLHGPLAPISAQIVDGERLALAQAHGRVGPFRVSFYSEDDSSRSTGQWDSGVTAAAAATAAHDQSTIAYLGDFNSAASAVSLPLINGAGILQISPSSPYVGLTQPRYAGQDEPDRFYPTGTRTFGRVAPSDYVQGAALVRFMSQSGVRRLFVIGDQNPFESSLSDIVAADAHAAGIQVIGTDVIDSATATFTSEAKKVAESGADTVFYGGGATPSTIALFQELYAADPALRLVGSSSADTPQFTAALGPAARNTYLGSPALPAGDYPPAAQRVLRELKARYGGQPQAYALFGYETMNLALQAIRTAGSHGNDRKAVIRSFFSLGPAASVLGPLSISPAGDSSITTFGIDRVVGGQPAFYRAITVPPAAPGTT